MNTERMLPSSQEAEEGVLGSLILDPEAIIEVAPILKPGNFYNLARKTIYDVILYLYQKDEPADFITVSHELERRNQLDDVGGSGYIMSLVNRVPTSGNAMYYARIIFRLSVRRELIRVAGQMAALAYEDTEEDLLSRCEEMVLAVGRDQVKREFVSMEEYMPVYLKNLEDRQTGDHKMRGMNTGLKALDGLIGGLQRGKLYIPAARPRIGKTTICQNIAYRGALKHGHKVGFFTLEMPKDEMMDRFMAMHTKLNSLHLQNGQIESDQWDLIVSAADVLSELGIYFEYTPGLYLDDLCSIARRLVHRHSIDLLVVDYLQLLKARIDGKRVQPREMEVAEIARTLKALAGELNIAILAPAQINRQVEHTALVKDERTGLSYRMPMLADLRESGEIEQSADVVMFLARAEEDETKVKIRIAKHRGGPEGEIDVYFDGPTTTFKPLAINYDEYGYQIEE